MSAVDLVHSLQQQLRLIQTYTRKSDAIRCQSALHELFLDSKQVVEEYLDLFTQLSSSVDSFRQSAPSEPLADADEAEADFYSAFQPALQIGFDRQDIKRCANTFAVVSAYSGADITLLESMHLLIVLQWYRDQQGSQSTLAASVVASVGPQRASICAAAPSVTAQWHAESLAAVRSNKVNSKSAAPAPSLVESVAPSGIQYAPLSHIQHPAQPQIQVYPSPPPPQILQHQMPQYLPYGTQLPYPTPNTNPSYPQFPLPSHMPSPQVQQPYFTQPQPQSLPPIYPSPSPSNMIQPGTMHPTEYQTKLSELANFTKLKGDLLRGAPTFTGKGDFDVFLSEFHEYLNAQPYMTEELRKNLLRSACRDTAREYLGSLTGLSGASFDVLVFSLRQRFGQTAMQRKLKFDKLSQYQSETMYEFADRVQKMAIGTERTMEEVIHRFLRGLRDSKLADKLTIQDFHSIPEVLARADKVLSLQRSERNDRRDHTNDNTNNRAAENKTDKSSSNARSSQKPAFKQEKKPFSKPARNHNCQCDDDVFSEGSVTFSDVDDVNALNMIEVFNLAEDEYSSAIEEVLAARAEQPKPKYNLRSQGGVAKPSHHSTSQQDQHNLRAALGLPTPPTADKTPSSTTPQPPTPQPSLPPTPMTTDPTPIPPTDIPPTPALPTPLPRASRTNQRSSLPSPGFAYLSGDKIPLGDYLSLLVGNNEFLQKVLISTLRRRYFELTTVKSSQVTTAEPSALALTSNPRPPRRSPLTWLPVQLGSSATVVGACADTGAEVSLISTAVLDHAGIAYDFDSLPDAYPVKGITQNPQTTKAIQFPMTFQHETTPLHVTINFCLIDSPDYRFLLGLDVLRPLAFCMSADTLTLTHPKSGVTADFPFEASKLFSLEVDDSVSVLTLSPLLPLAQKGDHTPASLCTKGDFSPPTSIFAPDLAINSSLPAPLVTKGDNSAPACAVNTTKSYHSFPLSSSVLNYVGPELTDLIQIEHFMVDSGLHQSFPDWSLTTVVDKPCDVVTSDSATHIEGEPVVLYYLDEEVSELALTDTHVLLCLNARFAYTIMQHVTSLGYVVVAVIGSFAGMSECQDDIVRYLVLISKQPDRCGVKQKVVPKVFLHAHHMAPPVARVFHQYGNLTRAIVHPSRVVLSLPANIPSLSLEGTPVSSSVANLAPLSGLPLHVHSCHFDADLLFTETQIVKFQFIQDHCNSNPGTLPTLQPIEPASDQWSYQLSDARFHLIDSEQMPLSSLEEATQYLTSLGIEFADHSPSFIQRGASVLQRTRAENPSAMNSELSVEEQTQLWQLLFDFQDICAFSFADMPQPALAEPFVIDTGTAKPISSRYYKLPAALETHLRSELTLNTQLGLMRHSSSPWASPLFAVPKPNKVAVFRTVADFRGLNAVTVPDRYPLPLISQVFEEIGHSKYFHANDLFSGFWQISCHPDSICKTAVTTRWGLFEYTRTPQGVRNAPSHFMRTINRLLTEEGLHHNNCAFVDDLTSHDATFEDSLVALRSVLSALRKIRMYIAPTKIRWGYTQLHLLGHLISQNQIRCQPSKIAAIAALPPPSDVSQLRSFLGITGYYRAFIADFAKLATPLFALLKKDVDFVWTPGCQQAFLALKEALQNGPVLNVPNPHGHFILYTDWSQDAVSAILHQDVDGVEYVIEYSSKTCNRHERNYCPTEGELLAIIYGLAKYRSYLLGQVFTIVTDHAALQYLNTSKASAKLARWGLFLSEFNFTIKYRKGSAHCNADALSRLPALPDCKFDLQALTCEVHFDDVHIADGLEELCIPQSVYQCSWHVDDHVPTLQHVRQELLESSPCLICDTDPQGDLPQVICDACNGVFHLHCLGMRKVPITYWYCLPCMQQYHQSPVYDITYDLDFQEYALGNRKARLLTNADAFEQHLADGYSFQHGTLTRFLHGRVYQYPSAGRQVLLLEEVHVRHGHVGAGRLYDLLSSEYWWPHLRQDCANFVAHCLACQLQKATFHREIPLEHLPLPQGPRLEWHIDLAPDLPVPSGVQQLIVCQDQFTKYIVLGTVLCRTSDSLAQWFHEHIISVFGVPQSVRSDQGSEFKGAFHQLLLDAGIRHITIPTESPWSNGAAERLVRTIKDFLKRVAVLEGEATWPSLLPSVQLGYNVAAHAASNVSPFELMFGGRARLIIEEHSMPNLPVKPSPSDYLRFTKEFLAQLRTQATKNRAAAQRRAVDTYGAATTTDGCLKQPAKELRVGQLVAIRRQPRTHLGVTSVGPFIVTEVTGAHITVRSLTSGRSRKEHRVNVIPLNLEFDAL